MTATERFLRYIAYDTASDEESASAPSSARQLVLSRALADEMNAMGLTDVRMDGCGNVIGTLPATTGATADAVAFVAHVDTSPAAPGQGVRPRFVPFTGGDVELRPGIVLSERQFPELRACRGRELIVTDGATLLGADDKAGVAEIMTMAETLLASGRPHGELRLVFTTDEEVGRGTEGLDTAALGCRYGYTVDGGPLGEYEYENFNAASARVDVRGVGIHPGSAKDIMVNACTVAMAFHGLLPPDMVPERTEGREGFIHLTDMRGTVTGARLSYILRDHDRGLLEDKKRLMREAAEAVNARCGAGTVTLELADTYYNMRQLIEPHMHLIDRVKAAFEKNGIASRSVVIRGGTDGAVLTWQGLPCPNLSTGGYNFHGVYECIPVDSLERMPAVLCDLACSFAEA